MNERKSVKSEVGEADGGHVVKSKKIKKSFFLRRAGVWVFPGSPVG